MQKPAFGMVARCPFGSVPSIDGGWGFHLFFPLVVPVLLFGFDCRWFAEIAVRLTRYHAREVTFAFRSLREPLILT